MKKEQIKNIEAIINEWGSTSSQELQLESSPVYEHLGKEHFSLVDRFNADDVDIITYNHGEIVDEFSIPYEELDELLIDEIHNIIEQYQVSCQKAWERSQS